jgi:hypothetical protein
MVGPNRRAPVEQHAHQHEYRREPNTVYFEDGAFILTYDCQYSEGKTYTDDARDETYYDPRYECSDSKQERLNFSRVTIVTDSDSESEQTTIIGHAEPDDRPLDEDNMDVGKFNTGIPTEHIRQLTFEAENLLAADLPGDTVEVDGGLYAAEHVETNHTTVQQADDTQVTADVTLPSNWVENVTQIKSELTLRLEYGNPE